MSTDINSNFNHFNHFINIMASDYSEPSQNLEKQDLVHIDHKFDETLNLAAGDVSVVMKISTN